MAIFKCKMCGGTIEFEPGATVGVCDSCGTRQTLPRLDDARRANLYDRANHFRRGNDFDKAAGIYEQILSEDNTDAEAYWSLVLCQYGIEYVEDPATGRRIPTVNRTQFTSIFDDDNYKSALHYADGGQRALYEQEAAAINEIQKGILAISRQEEPFDVFICYKESDASGRRTHDSVLANDLYHQLTNEGFKVFYSRITLEDKLGSAYEPYIFAALNSAKVMVVLGTRPEYFNAPWVKNEWSRYLALVKKSGGKKVLIPAYRDMDPYDLPEEFSHLQAQDMSKLGFMQDLIRGIRKIAEADIPKAAPAREAVSGGGADIAPLLRRVFLYLEDGAWDNADEYCERVLDIDPENAQAYLGKLMTATHCRSRKELELLVNPFDTQNAYQKVLRFGDEALRAELAGYLDTIKKRQEQTRLTKLYEKADQQMQVATTQEEYLAAAQSFSALGHFRDAEEKRAQCMGAAETARKDAIYRSASEKRKKGSIEALTKAAELFDSVPGWKDADASAEACREQIRKLQIQEADQKKKSKRIAAIAAAAACIAVAIFAVLLLVVIPNRNYQNALALYESGDYDAAITAFQAMDGYRDSEERIIEVQNAKTAKKYTEAEELLNSGESAQAALAFHALGDYADAKSRCLEAWDEAAVRETVSVEGSNIAGLKADGSVVAVGYNKFSQCDVSSWTDIIAVSTGGHTVGLKADGTVVAVGYNEDGECDVSDWTDIVAVSVGTVHTVGLKADGTVVAVGNNNDGQCDISDWTDIVAVYAEGFDTVGLKADGTVVATGYNKYDQCNVSNWTDIVAVSAGDYHTVGLKEDGTVVATGSNLEGECNVSDWKDIIAVSTGYTNKIGSDSYLRPAGLSVGLKSDGTVVATGDNEYGQCDVSGWTDIVAVSAGASHTVGLKADGTVVAVGSNMYGQCDVSGWTDIVAVYAGGFYTVGLKADGTVVATGDNEYGQCDVSGWKNIKLPKGSK